VPLTAYTDWFFITEMKSVYSAVRTGALNKYSRIMKDKIFSLLKAQITELN